MTVHAGPTFDAAAYKAEQLAGWSDTAQGWRQQHELCERHWAALSERLIELAAVKPGDRVLDVACGIGAPAFAAARKIGPTGHVLATDLSPQMVKIGRQRAAETRVENIEFRVLDADSIDLPEASFDAALCRWGLMFFADLHAALNGILHALIQGGRFAACTVAQPAEHTIVTTTLDAILAALQLPPPPDPRPARPDSSASPPRRRSSTRSRTPGSPTSAPTASPCATNSRPGAELAAMETSINPLVKRLLAAKPDRRADALAAIAHAALEKYGDDDGRVKFPPAENIAIVASGARTRGD